MKTLIIYKSETGFTKRYAEMIEHRTSDSTLVELKKLKKKDIKEADFIFYGGPIHNNVIKGLSKFLKHHKLFDGKDIFIFGVGLEPASSDKRENVINANGLSFYHVRLYLLTGGLDFTKMSKFKKKIISLGLKAAAQKGDLPMNADPSQLSSLLDRRIDMVSSDQIEKMINVYNLVVAKRMN